MKELSTAWFCYYANNISSSVSSYSVFLCVLGSTASGVNLGLSASVSAEALLEMQIIQSPSQTSWLSLSG